MLSLSPLFSDGAVLPKGLAFSVFGKSDENGTVVLTFPNGWSHTASFVSEKGVFSADFPAIDCYSEGGTLSVKTNSHSLTVSDIAIGEVILAAGQSNMEFHVSQTIDFPPLVPSEKLRFFEEGHYMDAADETQTVLFKEGSNRWFKADGESEKTFSAIGYLVGRLLSEKLDIPVGVINCNRGASRIESWVSKESYLASELDHRLGNKYPDFFNYHFNRDHWLYRNKFAEVKNYPFSAVLWYQGESNTGFDEAEHYGELLSLLFREWRRENKNENLPFYLVELAPFDCVAAGWSDQPLGDWAVVREAERKASQTEKNVYTVSLTESGEYNEVHPVHKRPVAEKLCNAILATKFGKDVEYTGPVFDDFSIKDGVLRISFTHGKGLRFCDFKGNKEEAKGCFFIGKDGKKTEANVSLDGDSLLVTLSEDSDLFCMGYENAPTHNLYNEARYLASPFRIKL